MHVYDIDMTERPFFIRSDESDMIGRQYCAMALGNLAAEPENHLEIIKSDGIDALIVLLRTEDIEAGVCPLR